MRVYDEWPYKLTLANSALFSHEERANPLFSCKIPYRTICVDVSAALWIAPQGLQLCVFELVLFPCI